MAKRFPRGDVRNQKLYGYRYSGKMVVNKSGYQYREIEIVEEEAKIVRRIFEQVAAGEDTGAGMQRKGTGCTSWKRTAEEWNPGGMDRPPYFPDGSS